MSEAIALARRYSIAKANWYNWRSIYDEAYAFTIPQKDPWPEEVVEGVRKNIWVYDTTAVVSARRLVSRLHASLTPPGQQWFELEAGDYVRNPNARKQLNEQLQVFSEIIFKALYDSNFDLVINEFLQDLIIGTGAMQIFEGVGEELLKFKAVALNVCYPEGDAFDDIETVWTDFTKVVGRDITQIWPKAKIPQSLLHRIKADPEATFDFTEGFVYQAKERLFKHCVFEMGTNQYLLENMTPSSPWVVARWSKASNEVGGRGPVLDAMPTIRSLNRLVEDILRNVGLSTSPPWMAASDGVFNPYLFEIQPNKMIPISAMSLGSLPLQKLDVSGDIRMGTLEVQDLRQQIKDALFDHPIRPIDAPKQTATESMIRQQSFQEEIGPAFGRLSVELLPKIINRVIFILQKKGYLPNGLKIDNKLVNIRYKSPLVRSAQIQKIQNLQNYNTIMQSLLGPELSIGTLNLNLIPEYLSDKLDVDERLIKSPDEIDSLIKQVIDSQRPQEEALPNPNLQLANQRINQEAQGSVNA